MYYQLSGIYNIKIPTKISPSSHNVTRHLLNCKMRFTIRQAGRGSERIGNLTGLTKTPNANIETPAFGLLTQGGSVVHLTAEVLAKVFTNPQLLWVPLSNSAHLENGAKAQGEGIAKFAGLQDHATCVTLHNMNETVPAGHFEADKVPLWTKQGKKLITADRFMDVMEIFKPDIILAIADSNTSLSDSLKRISKSVERTCNMLDKCVYRYKGSTQLQNSALIGVIVGAGDEKKCESCIKHILTHKEHLTGVALSGLSYEGGEGTSGVLPGALDEVFRRVGASLPSDLVRVVEGCWNPAVIMSAIDHGWDVFDGSYTVKLSNAGQAMVMEFELGRYRGAACVLDMNDEKYKDDFRPVLEGCECLACKKHTRAYIRHLLNTREMLASVLLSIHNLHHFDQLFRHTRSHIAAGTFPTFKKLITDQYELYTSQLPNKLANGNGHTDDVEMAKDDIPMKKIKVSNGEDFAVARNIVNGS